MRPFMAAPAELHWSTNEARPLIQYNKGKVDLCIVLWTLPLPHLSMSVFQQHTVASGHSDGS